MKKSILLFSLLFIAFSTFSQMQDCSELFISEYVEGPGNNNALEIYNPTGSTIDLNGYTINRYANASQTISDSWTLSGSISSGEAISIGNGQLDSVWVSTYWSLPVDPAFYAACDLHGSGVYPTPFYFNGDDALTLEKGTDIIDIFGKVGEDPGNAWTDDASAGFTDANGGVWWTKRQTLVRKSSVKKGVNLNPILFNPTLEWDSLPDATYAGLGSHNCDCITTNVLDRNEETYIMYPNPAEKGSKVALNSINNIKAVIVYNLLGKRENFITPESKNAKIKTSEMRKGIYFVEIYFENGNMSNTRLIIK